MCLFILSFACLLPCFFLRRDLSVCGSCQWVRMFPNIYYYLLYFGKCHCDIVTPILLLPLPQDGYPIFLAHTPP